MRSRILLTVVLLSAALAQVDTGAVTGVVTDASNSAVSGAAIKVLHGETNRQTELTTNDSGFYAAPGLRPGRYVVTVSTGADWRNTMLSSKAVDRKRVV